MHLEAPYRNIDLPIESRVDNLLKQMSLEEKAGQMFHSMIVMGPNGALAGPIPPFGIPATEELICERLISHFNVLGPVEDAMSLARWHNLLQSRAGTTRLGIPITLSTDPRNHFVENLGTGARAGAFSQWPEPLGFAALRSPELTERFADVARQEYLATGLRTSLGPQVDLATEPRWARISGTFGEDGDLSGSLGAAYVRGFQHGGTISPTSVSCMGKHFPGAGPQKDGEDPHFPYGREQVYPGDAFDYHLAPFKALVDSGISQMMPYYGMPSGTQLEEVGFAFNKAVITGLLREQLRFDGIVCSDWQVITDKVFMGEPMVARAWGVEHLDSMERIVKLLDAGCDQFGGEECPDLLVRLVEQGRVSEARIDNSVRKILREKFALGLFDDAFVDPDYAAAVVGKADFKREGESVQRRSYTLLSNPRSTVPLPSTNLKIYVEGLRPETASSYGFQIAQTPGESDLTILRIRSPYEERPGKFEHIFHAGSLEFNQSEKERLIKVMSESKLSILDVYLDRPAILTGLVEHADAIFVNYGASDEACLDIVTGRAAPEGKLPFDLPSSMKAVSDSRSDRPFDTLNPVFKFGHGLSYGEK